MSLDPTVSFEDLERRRRRASEARKVPQGAKTSGLETESEALAVINEIFNPSLKLPESTGPYKLPKELTSDDANMLKDLDISKLAELKEVFLLFDTDCDGLISKEDLRFTFIALGNDAPEDLLEQMMGEVTEPITYEVFVELMTRRTSELDPEDVLLEAWSKWDDYGTGKIDERSCLDHIEIFPYLREPVIESATQPEYVVCNHTATVGSSFSNRRNRTNVGGSNQYRDEGEIDFESKTDDGLLSEKFIYSSSRIIGIRLRFVQPPANITKWIFNITGEFKFIKKLNYQNDGRLIKGSYCDYYFFANTDEKIPEAISKWKYFHSPRYPAHYPSHIKCSYKFIGRPESRVHIVFEELEIPKQSKSCTMDQITIFDAETANMNNVMDVICNSIPQKPIISSGPDLLLEFNASSNRTAKGFRGKYKFLSNNAVRPAVSYSTEIALPLIESKQSKLSKEEFCSKHFDSAVKKGGLIDTSELMRNASNGAGSFENSISAVSTVIGKFECRFEFTGQANEKIQIKFLDFNIPPQLKGSSQCSLNESLQLLSESRGKYEVSELFCGAFLPRPILSNDQSLLMKFIGNYQNALGKSNYYGFKAEFKFVTDFGITASGKQIGNNCTFVHNSTERKSGHFSSPNFPGYYITNLECNYMFFGEPGEYVTIRFSYFDVEGILNCEFGTASDYVEFSNFMSTDRKFRKYCGKRNKFEVRSDGRFFRVAFISNDRFVSTGFQASYDFDPVQKVTLNTSVQRYLSNINQAKKLKPFIFFTILLTILLNHV